MPIYEYKCSKCGVFEAMQGIKEAPLRKCPTCKGKVERQISRGSFILKGSGWYATDYAKGKASGGESSESATTPATNGTASASDSSSKPAAETKPSSESATPAKSKSSSEKASSEKSASTKAAD